jgi:hypothetical protein
VFDQLSLLDVNCDFFCGCRLFIAIPLTVVFVGSDADPDLFQLWLSNPANPKICVQPLCLICPDLMKD